MRSTRLAKLLLASGLCSVVAGGRPAAAPAELGRHVQARLGEAARGSGKFSFGVLSDPHIHYSKYGWQDAALRANLERLTRAGVAFVVVTGDLGTYETVHPDGVGFTRQPDKFLQVLRSVPGCPPVLVTMGNHETDGEGKRVWLEALYPEAARGLTGNGNDRVYYYAFDYRDAHFACLDANRDVGGTMVWATLPEEELAWLDADLRAHRDRPTFVLLHEPIKPHPDKPAHLLQNRGRLIQLLRRHPQARWFFGGHDHYGSHGRAWGLDVSHVDRTATNVDGTAGLVVRVDGKAVSVEKFDAAGRLAPAADDYDLDPIFASRLERAGGRARYRIAETALAVTRNDPLRDAIRLVGPSADVRPTQGDSMIQVDRAAGRLEGERSGVAYAWISTDVIEIRKGTKFGYDVRVDPVSPSDRIALILDLDLPAGAPPPDLRDQNGLPLGTVDAEGGGSGLPSLGDRARGRWYRREFDLSRLAGGCIVSARLYANLAEEGGPAERRLRFQLDDIHLSWPDRR